MRANDWLVVWKGGVYPVGLTLLCFWGLVVCDVVRPSLTLRACPYRLPCQTIVLFVLSPLLRSPPSPLCGVVYDVTVSEVY
jgi:hypothetical protein